MILCCQGELNQKMYLFFTHHRGLLLTQKDLVCGTSVEHFCVVAQHKMLVLGADYMIWD